jgi:hypothetical protein
MLAENEICNIEVTKSRKTFRENEKKAFCRIHCIIPSLVMILSSQTLSPKNRATAKFVNTAFSGETLMGLVNLADARDTMVADSPAGFFPDVVSGSVDMSMAMAETMLKFSDSLDSDSVQSEEIFCQRIHEFIISVLDAVYGPNCVRISVYNPDIDWSISLWHMLHSGESDHSPSDRGIPSQGESLVQWVDLKTRLIGHCRNPKKDAQRIDHIHTLEQQLAELTAEHAALLEKLSESENGNPPTIPDPLLNGSIDRKSLCRKVVLEKHRISDPTIRSKRDAILWGGPPHMAASSAAGNTKRRLSRFGFKSEEDYISSESSSEGIPTSPQEEDAPGRTIVENGSDTPLATKPVGCLAMFRCCK